MKQRGSLEEISRKKLGAVGEAMERSAKSALEQPEIARRKEPRMLRRDRSRAERQPAQEESGDRPLHFFAFYFCLLPCPSRGRTD